MNSLSNLLSSPVMSKVECYRSHDHLATSVVSWSITNLHPWSTCGFVGWKGLSYPSTEVQSVYSTASANWAGQPIKCSDIMYISLVINISSENFHCWPFQVLLPTELDFYLWYPESFISHFSTLVTYISLLCYLWLETEKVDRQNLFSTSAYFYAFISCTQKSFFICLTIFC